MSWPNDAPLHNFNEFSIVLNAEQHFGVYALFDKQHQILLVDTGEVQKDLLRLTEGADQMLAQLGPAYFSYVLATCEDTPQLKDELLKDLTPLLAHVDVAARLISPRPRT